LRPSNENVEKEMKFTKNRKRNFGDGKPIDREENLEELNFKIFKMNDKQKPQDPYRIIYICCFFEFGCESLALMYMLPKIIRNNPNCYFIAIGWFGREYLYRHLVDEYWELDEKFQFLRDYSNAFANSSKNLTAFYKKISNNHTVYSSAYMSKEILTSTCLNCNCQWVAANPNECCPNCKLRNVERSIFSDMQYHKQDATPIPLPSSVMIEEAKRYVKPNTVGVFARSRTTYGRNLRQEFYVDLINLLENRGYNVIWLGEKQSVMPCPLDHIVDFSRLPESRNLELTLAIISQLKFTIQFWTASTRLSSMVQTPWILFESPDQILGNGQEGKRIYLTTHMDKKKIVLSQFWNVMEREKEALDVLNRTIDEMDAGNWTDVIGLVDNPEFVYQLLQNQMNSAHV
jgi:hypothetical protein